MIGVDLGGTNVRACAFDELGNEVGERVERPSHAQQGTEAIMDAVAGAILAAEKTSTGSVEAVGLAIPGFVDNAAGMVLWAPNFGETINGIFHFWSDVPIAEPLRQRTKLPVHMGNDANLAALGEYRYGSGKNSANCLVMLTLGTGIGGGVVLSPAAVDGDARGPLILVGGNKGGAELGHVVIAYQGLDCPAGEYGAIEGYCGRDAIIKRAVHRLVRGRTSYLTDLVDGDLSKIQPKTISEAANRGDEVAIEVFEEVGTMLGVAIGNYINIFAPDVLAVGGQIALAGDWIMKPAIKAARNVAVDAMFKYCRITVAEQLDDAGLLGGAAFAHEALRWSKPN